MKATKRPVTHYPPHVVLAKRMLKISEESTGETVLQAALLVIKIVNKVQGPKAVNTDPLTAKPTVESNTHSSTTTERQNHEPQ